MPKLFPALLVSLLALVVLFAHQPLSGTLPGNAPEGLLVGMMQPIMALDPLVLLLAAALLGVASGPDGWAVPLGFALASLGGSAFAVGLWGVPEAAPALLGISLLFMAAMLLGGRTGPFYLLLAQLLGLACGTMLAAPMLEAAPAPMMTFLLGLELCQGGLALVAWQAASRLAPFNDMKLSGVHFAVAAVLGGLALRALV
jgi:hypothetical protein